MLLLLRHAVAVSKEIHVPLIKPHQLTIMTTSKCTARCDHCLVNSGPERSERLKYEEMRKCSRRKLDFVSKNKGVVNSLFFRFLAISGKNELK